MVQKGVAKTEARRDRALGWIEGGIGELGRLQVERFEARLGEVVGKREEIMSVLAR